MILNENNLNNYAKNGFNVIFSGRHGVGKTEIIKKIFDNNFGVNKEGAENWVYFSASTMDPWVDFIGVPKAVTNTNGDQVLELIRPARFHDDTIQGIFFDEFNRAPQKIRNAVMELIQFKSINGRKFKNLKVIWAAINPFDEEGTYDVDKIDPAQLDRFEIQLEVPYKIDGAYMKKKHGSLAIPFIQWWNNLSADIRFKISPRRIDKSIEVYKIGGELKDVLPAYSNVSELIQRIKSLSLDDEWDAVQSMTTVERSLFFANLGNITKFEQYILKEFSTYAEYVPEDLFISNLETMNQNWVNESLNNINSLNKSLILTMEKKHKTNIKDILKSFVIAPQSSFSLAGKNVVLTGKFELNYKIGSPKRNNIVTIIETAGGYVQDKIGANTSYLITPDPNTCTSKAQDAISRKIPIISEKDFHSAYGHIV